MSQDYTPVSWVDETTSQQGTLINAERLNQMQTAHHYADGFEEVDAIPTEDPGVDYHKVVYCTADATFYRWDGTQWAADIDEDTKHLLDQEIARAEHAEGLIQGYLDAHEANRNNPHQVTKAQVGLGNCDNTADADKPISTAVQAALDTKADKATTLAGYGITDAYTKAQADTLLADKADKADVYDKTAADTLLAGKVDKLVSSPAGTYKSVTVNAQGQVTAGTNPDTLAGYGITDAYTKTEADNLLAAKADATALTDGSVTKVGTADLGTDTKPIKLVAGVPTAVGSDLVTIDTEQTITNAKNFDFAPRGLRYGSTTTGYKEAFKIPVNSNLSSVTCYLTGRVISKSATRTATFMLAFRTSDYTPVLYVSAPVPSLFCTQNADYSVSLWISDQRVILYADTLSRGNYGGEYGISAYIQTSTTILPAKPAEGADYLKVVDSAIMPDLIDKDALDGYAPMVRIANAQTIGGEKTFTSTIIGTARQLVGQISSTSASANKYRLIWKIKRTELTGTRNHYLFYVFTRARANAPDSMVIYSSNGALSGFNMVTRANAASYTYILSYDENYAYLYIITQAGAVDAVQVVLAFSTEGNGIFTNYDSDLGDYDAIAGTEYGRLTP